jgi:hypothetical protein
MLSAIDRIHCPPSNGMPVRYQRNPHAVRPRRVVREFVKKVVDTDMDYSFARACALGVDDALTKTAAKG